MEAYSDRPRLNAVPSNRTIRPALFLLREAANGWTIEAQGSDGNSVTYVAKDVPGAIALISALAEAYAEKEVHL